MTGVDVAAIRADLIEWGTGRKSWTNEFMTVENGPENRVATLAAIAVADAAETAKLAALYGALAGDALAVAERQRDDALAKIARGLNAIDLLTSSLLDPLRFGDLHAAKLSPNEVVHCVLRALAGRRIPHRAAGVGSEPAHVCRVHRAGRPRAHMLFAEFWAKYFAPQGIGPGDVVTRIEWRYLDGEL